jgi:hypothetical protein
MAVFNIYELNEAEQLDLFYSKSDGNLDLDKIQEKMAEFISPSEDGEITGEGFLQIRQKERSYAKSIEAFATGSGTLGYYTQAFVEEDQGNDVSSKRKQQQFFSKSRIFLTEEGFLIIFFDDTTEERIKKNIKNLIENLGFEANNFHLSDQLMRKVRAKYDWQEVHLEKVENDRDSTSKVYYEIDIADTDNESKIDKIYGDKGKMVQISYEMAYDKGKEPLSKTVKLYKNDNRIVIDPEEFPEYDDLADFVVYLAKELISLTK